MNVWDRRLVVWSSIAVTLTGLGYAWYRYAAKPTDPFALHHPAQATWQHLHVWVAPVFVFAVGVIWRQHIWRHLVSGVSSRRRSGLVLIALLVPMVLTGYLLQTSVAEAARQLWMSVHLVTSAIWSAAFCGHLWPLVRRRRTS